MDAEDVSIPVDFFISRMFAGLSRGELGFADSLGNIVYRVEAQPESNTIKLVLDLQGVLFVPSCNAKLHDNDEKGLICNVKTTRSSFTRREVEVLMNQENSNLPPLKIEGFPFHRSCTVYGSDSIIAQTSLMYKLKQIYAEAEQISTEHLSRLF